MKSRPVWITAGWIMTLLIIFAQVMIQLGRQETNANPSIDNDGASGYHAFARLLRHYGYSVRNTRSVGRRVLPGELPIAISTDLRNTWLTDDAQETNDPYLRFIARHFAESGDLLLLYVDANFPSISNQAKSSSSKTTSPAGTAFTTSCPVSSELADQTDSESGTLWFDSSNASQVWWQSVGNGRVFYARGGLYATNRFIDKNDNAAYMLEVVNMAAQGRKKIVFLESAHSGPREESITALIGPWAEGAWTQVLIAFAAAVVVLGIRFGLPSDERFRQRGTRELVDAFADMLGRTKSSHVALDQIAKSNDLMVRRRLKIPQDATTEVRDKQLPDGLARLFWEAEQAIATKADRSICLAIARKLDHECNQLVGKSEQIAARIRRRAKA